MTLLLPVARAALRESAELAALYERLVPAKAHASAFWFCFFEHAQVIRRSTLPPTCIRSQSAEKRDAEDEWESFLASPLRVARLALRSLQVTTDGPVLAECDSADVQNVQSPREEPRRESAACCE